MAMTHDLFGTQDGERHSLGAQAAVLRGFALPFVDDLIPALRTVEAASSFRHMVTPGGFSMSIAMTNCGRLGWTKSCVLDTFVASPKPPFNIK